MSKGLLPEHIGPLVDRLRAGDHQAISLPDVAALTEVLMRSLESYFKSIDLTIYAECQSLADYIDDARLEISSLSPDHDNSAGIPRAGLELEAIVQQTESATNIIMESAESIMEASTDDMEAYTTIVNDAVMQIFEACSFQDITGQRISKVVSTLEHVESRVGRLINILGVMENGQGGEQGPVDEDKALLNGPALEGEGIGQSEIDALLNGKAENFTPAEKKPEENKPEGKGPEGTDSAATAPSAEVAAEDQPTAQPANDGGNAVDIDFIFDGPAKKAEEINPPAVLPQPRFPSRSLKRTPPRPNRKYPK
ncbi:MAG: protein phosphatase CheZ [Alphaproteobacteria bacterium]|nr:protein phosphatase CheZ [Alphaproteobacteria bacterium]